MRIQPRPVLMFALLLAVCAAPARAQNPAPTQPAPGPAPTQPAPTQPAPMPPAPNPTAETPPVYVVSFVEVGPSSAAKAAGILHRYAVFSRKEPGNMAIVALREHQRPGRFAIVEEWHDKAAHDAHVVAAKEVGDRLQPLLAAPIDSRICSALDVAPSAADSFPAAKGTVYVVTHVDVIPTHKDATVALIEALVAASRKEPGNLRFDALRQDDRANHMFLIEAWRDRTARNAHVGADATKEFRAKESPFAGALYDERLYEVVR